jgi:putative radical SAM enzyme (TIGR03279 family)
MNKIDGYLIDKVKAGSPAEAAGIKTGWKLLRVDNYKPKDIIDYKIAESDDSLSLLLLTKRGLLRRVKIYKSPGVSLGLTFDPPTMSRLQGCSNNCIFCFVGQNPANMRKALYVKDDDYRLSFLYGNFITLNRVTDDEIERIIKLQLSPLYVSVHTTNPDLRLKMFGNKLANRGLNNLVRLAAAGIKIHAQLVLCPGLNTGHELERTIADLDQMGPNILDVALVPVGLTEHRSGLAELREFTAGEAKELIELSRTLQNKFLLKRNSRFVFVADEFYILGGVEFPADSEYEGYPQLENGVGLARLFLNELDQIAAQDPVSITIKPAVSILTGKAAEPLLKALGRQIEATFGLKIKLIAAENRYFGSSVTVAGLLTGSDLLAALEGISGGSVVFISKALLREDSELFLDDMTVTEIEKKLNIQICPVCGPLELIAEIRAIALRNKNMGKRGPGH